MFPLFISPYVSGAPVLTTHVEVPVFKSILRFLLWFWYLTWTSIFLLIIAFLRQELHTANIKTNKKDNKKTTCETSG